MVKLLLIVALRLGNVSGSTIDEVLDQARLRRDKTILWTHPERPIHCAYAPVGISVQVDKPAQPHQAGHTLAALSRMAGVLTKLRSHDIRRGAARDLSHLGPISGLPTKQTSLLMGHSDKAFRQGVTARYVGSPSVDLWSSRLNSNYEDKLGLDTSASTPLKRKRLTPEEITRYCEENDLDARSKGVRDKAGKWIQKTYRDDQIAKAQNGSSPKRSSRGQLTYHIPLPCSLSLQV